MNSGKHSHTLSGRRIGCLSSMSVNPAFSSQESRERKDRPLGVSCLSSFPVVRTKSHVGEKLVSKNDAEFPSL